MWSIKKRILITFRSPKLFFLTILYFLIFIIILGAIYYWNIGSLEFYKKHNQEIQFVKKLSNIFYLPHFFSSSKLENYNLIINKDDLIFLNNNLPETYAGKLLTKKYRKKIKAKFVANEKEYNVKVRYHGDMDNHWRDSKKSWVIAFTDEYFNGIKELHLVIPVDRNYLLEELNFYRARKAGLLTTPTKFVNFSVNNSNQGVYWQFESWNTEMLEKRNLSANTKLYGGINDYQLKAEDDYNYFKNSSYWRIYAPKNFSNDFTELNILLNILNNPNDKYFKENIGKIVDLENFYQWQINQILVGSVHQIGANMRFYFDPAVGKFKFIPWDVSIGKIYSAEKSSNQLIKRILGIPEFSAKQNELLKKYINNPDNLTDDLKFYNNLDKLTKNDFYKDFKKVENHFEYRKNIKNIKQKIINRFNFLKNNL